MLMKLTPGLNTSNAYLNSKSESIEKNTEGYQQAIAQSNPNQSQICDSQSKSKSDFQNALTIQSKSNHNPTIFGKR